MKLKQIDEFEYQQMLYSKLCSKQDMFKLASYPYVSLLSKYKNLMSYEQRKIRIIEDDSVFAFFHILTLLFGIGSQSEIDTLNRNIYVEPLRSAVIAARQEIDPAERVPKYIELACKILLSLEEWGYNRMNVINIRVRGKLPGMPFSNRQKIADEWFNTFVNIKLEGMKKVYRELGAEMAYTFVVSTTLHSLYHFAPERYHIEYCQSEDEALHKVLRIFLELIDIKDKKS
jgi:hypothetical protein